MENEGPSAHKSMQLIMHYDGNAWALIRHDLGAKLLAVRMVSPTAGWAVGEEGHIQRFDGREWQQYHSTGISRVGLEAIAVVAPDDIWFVGDGQVLHLTNELMHYWGGARMAPWLDGLTAVSVLPDGTGWAAGWAGPLLTRRSEAWRELDGVPHDVWLAEVVAQSHNDVWASYTPPSPPGVLAHFDGARWSEVPLPTDHSVTEFSYLNPTSIWAVAPALRHSSPQIETDILHYNGSEWRIVHSAKGALLPNIHMLSDNDGWVAGETLMRFNGSSWIEQPLDIDLPRGYFLDVSFASSEQGWIAGGKWLLEFRDGSWHPTQLALPYPDDYFIEVRVAPKGHVWLAGAKSVWWYQGTHWEPIPIPIASRSPYSYHSIAIVSHYQTYDVW